ncbi:hypothetical protein [Streptomyces sp. GSL17-111]|uniref:hypothetical protein n=1 Tax=Streptomyces sp. GSL17-111 TaxID=3121596 RepID=UPI0030F3ABE7
MSRPALNLTSTVSEDEDEDVELFGGPAPELTGDGQGSAVMSALTGADVTRAVTVDDLPTPHDAPEDAAELSEEDRRRLSVCEEALRGFRKSAVVAGKALEVINRGRLYRDTHATFADYVSEVWGIQRAHAYRMMDAWPVAALSPKGDINEAQARAMIPVYRLHGPEATAALYAEVRELSGGRVTAATLREAREVLPHRVAEPGQVRDVLRVAVAEGRVPRLSAPRPSPDRDAEPDPGGAGSGGPDEVRQGAEDMATLEAAVAQQRQITERVTRQVVESAQFYDPGRAERLRHELRQLAGRVMVQTRDEDPNEHP